MPQRRAQSTVADPWAQAEPQPAPEPTEDHGTHRPGCLTAVTGPGCMPPPGWRTQRPDEWVRSLRPHQLTGDRKSVALTLASYANKKDGKNARPGLDRLAWASGTSVITCRRTLADLQLGWLIHCSECGNGRNHATVWWLTTHDQMDRVVTFEQWKEMNG